MHSACRAFHKVDMSIDLVPNIGEGPSRLCEDRAAHASLQATTEPRPRLAPEQSRQFRSLSLIMTRAVRVGYPRLGFMIAPTPEQFHCLRRLRDWLAALPDSRQPCEVSFPISEVLVMAFCVTRCDGSGFIEM